MTKKQQLKTPEEIKSMIPKKPQIERNPEEIAEIRMGRRKNNQKVKGDFERDLSVRESLLVMYISSGDPVEQALEKAGYKCKTGIHRIFRSNPLLRKKLNESLMRKVSLSEISESWKLTKLKRCIDVAIPDDFTNLSKFEMSLVKISDAIGAIAEINKMQGGYAAAKSHHDINVIPIKLEEKEELKRMIEINKKDY